MPKPGKQNAAPEWKGFAKVLHDVVQWNDENDLPLAVVGGLAVGIYSRPRATKDIDVSLITSLPPAELAASLAPFGFQPAFVESVELAQDLAVLAMRHSNNTIVDFIYARFPFQEQRVHRAEVLKFGELDLPVVQLEDLAAMKLEAGRPQDLVDVQQLIRANPKMRRNAVLEAIRAYAELTEQPELFEQAQKILEASS